jgi:23S rRNA pseudouridine1911/1915/1917 synthase
MTSKSDAPGDDDDDEVEVDIAPATRELPPGADPSIDWGLTSHHDATGTPRIVERRLVVPPELAGLRLDHFLKAQITRLSRTKIQQIIDTQLTRADGATAKASTTVAAGDRFVIRRPAPPEPPCPRTFTVLVDDPRLLVIDKPAGLPVHASAKFYFNTSRACSASAIPTSLAADCHRLDRETSGCLVVARDREAAALLKHVRGEARHQDIPRGGRRQSAVARDEVTLDIPLRIALPGDPTRLPHVRMLAGPAARPRSRGSRRRAARPIALVRCTLVTGRQHQIRATSRQPASRSSATSCTRTATTRSSSSAIAA